MKTVNTGWRTVTPGECLECGCDCQACPDCGIIDAYGFHEPTCPKVKEAEEAT